MLSFFLGGSVTLITVLLGCLLTLGDGMAPGCAGLRGLEVTKGFFPSNRWFIAVLALTIGFSFGSFSFSGLPKIPFLFQAAEKCTEFHYLSLNGL